MFQTTAVTDGKPLLLKLPQLGALLWPGLGALLLGSVSFNWCPAALVTSLLSDTTKTSSSSCLCPAPDTDQLFLYGSLVPFNGK